MWERLKRLLEARARAHEKLTALLDTAEAEDRDLTAEEREQADRLHEEMDSYREPIRQCRNAIEGQREADEARDLLPDDPRPEADPVEAEGPTDADKFRALARGEVRSVEFPITERRDLLTTTAAAGGDTVPTSFLDRLYEHMVEMSSMRQTRATVITTTSGEDLEVPKTTGRSSASIVAEGAAIGESDPTFGQVVLETFKYGHLVQVSFELLNDTGVDLEGFLARDAGIAIGNGTGAHYTTGSGTGQPRGVVTAATVGVTGGTGQSGIPTADELIELFYSVIGPYRRNGEWMLSSAGIREVRQLKDNDGQYLWQPALTGTEPDMLLGKPVIDNPDVADPALNAKSVVFGDLSTYYIRDAGSVRVERSDHFAFNTDLATFRFLFRTDGDLIDETGSVKVYQGAGT